MKKRYTVFAKYIVLGFLGLLLGSCAHLPPIYKVKPAEIRNSGVIFMLPKCEIYLYFNLLKTDSTGGLIAGYNDLVEQLKELYNFRDKMPMIEHTHTTFKYSDFGVTSNLVPDTSETYLFQVDNKSKGILSNLDFSFKFSNSGLIEATDVASSNEAFNFVSSVALAGINTMAPFYGTGGVGYGRGASVMDTAKYNHAKMVFDKLKSNREREEQIKTGVQREDLYYSNFLLANLAKEDSSLFNQLTGTYKSTVSQSPSFYLPEGNNVIYITKTVANNNSVEFSETSDSSLAADNLAFKVKTTLLNNFKLDSYNEKQSTGLPYKLPERMQVEVFNHSGALVSSNIINIPGKQTYRLPSRFNAFSSHLSVNYNPDGTINYITSSGHTLNPYEFNSILSAAPNIHNIK